MADYDAIVIGAGHNGLTASCYLAKAGLKVLTLEKNSFVGGLASTQEIFPGFRFSIGAHVLGLYWKKIRDELELEKFGLKTFDLEPLFFTPFPSGRYFMWYWDLEKSVEEIKKQFSSGDAEGFRKYMEFWKSFSVGIGAGFLNPPVSIGKIFDVFKGPEPEDAMRKLFFYSAKEFLDELIESEELKGAIAYWAVDGIYAGPMTPGTNLVVGVHFASGEPYRFVKGGMGGVSEALSKAFQSYGGTLQLNCPVGRVLVEKGRVTGVETREGEKITAKVVLSNVDAQNLFLKLVGSEHLPQDFIKMVKNMKFRPVHIQAFCALSELPDYRCLPGKKPGPQHNILVVAPSVEYVERAWDDCKYGRPSQKPVVLMSIPSIYDSSMAPEGKYAASLYIQFAPYDLREGEWDRVKEELADRAIAAIDEYAPNFKDSIIQRKVFSPLDYENMFGATRGNLWHGDILPAQMFTFRPVPGWSQYRTPLKGLYLCGATAHPGGGVTGTPGHNAAHVVLEEWKKI